MLTDLAEREATMRTDRANLRVRCEAPDFGERRQKALAPPVPPCPSALPAVPEVDGKGAVRRVDVDAPSRLRHAKQLVDECMTQQGGVLFPPEYTVARFFYRGGWSLSAGDSLLCAARLLRGEAGADLHWRPCLSLRCRCQRTRAGRGSARAGYGALPRWRGHSGRAHFLISTTRYGFIAVLARSGTTFISAKIIVIGAANSLPYQC
jgi:hypothetical protein